MVLQPLPFVALRQFFPNWIAEERVVAYAVVPICAGWIRSAASATNIRQIVVAPGSMFMAEPMLLLYKEVCEPAVYQAILQAIRAGRHTSKEIGDASLISQSHLSAYLNTLQELRLIKRRLPVILIVAQQHKSR